MQTKRLFFGFEIKGEWNKPFPKGRLLREQDFHMTLVFFGNTDFDVLSPLLNQIPLPEIGVEKRRMIDRLLFLPKHHPRVVAGHLNLEEEDPLLLYQKKVEAFFASKGYPLPKRDFLPHITFARSPFSQKEWEAYFKPISVQIGSLNLYESVGNLTYKKIWSYEEE